MENPLLLVIEQGCASKTPLARPGDMRCRQLGNTAKAIAHILQGGRIIDEKVAGETALAMIGKETCGRSDQPQVSGIAKAIKIDHTFEQQMINPRLKTRGLLGGLFIRVIGKGPPPPG